MENRGETLLYGHASILLLLKIVVLLPDLDTQLLGVERKVGSEDGCHLLALWRIVSVGFLF